MSNPPISLWPKGVPPKKAAPLGAPPPLDTPKRSFAFGQIAESGAIRCALYGTGGIGKTSLACRAPGPVAFFDLDDSLRMLKPGLGGLEIKPVEGVRNWLDIREALAADIWTGIKTIVVDTVTRAEELAVAHTIATVKHEKGHAVQRVEDYGFGKGYSFVYDTFLPLFGDLDQHVRAGRNVILVAHEEAAKVPNPAGDDFLRWEPRLQSSPKSNLRSKLKDWCDFLFFIDYDAAISRGKAAGSGTRTIFPNGCPAWMAKSRGKLTEPLAYADGSNEVWNILLGA